jgi:hypothetical protein
VICLAPRVPGEIVGPRRLSGVVVRPLNFTVRALAQQCPRHEAVPLTCRLLHALDHHSET